MADAPNPLTGPEPASPPLATRGEWLLIALILLAGAAFRLVALDRLPGINGDEAWYGVQAVSAVKGQAHAWRTASGNPLNSFFLGPLAALHAVAPAPAFWKLRAPAALSGLLLVALAYPLLRRCLGRRAALLATVLLCALPVDIGYSRLGWDPSQSCLALLVCFALMLQRRHVWAGLAFGAAVLVHPTNIFAAPAAAGIAVAAGAARLRAMPPARRRRVGLIVALVAATGAVLGVAVILVAAPRWAALGGWNGTVIVRRAVDPGGWLAFVALYGRLLSGVTLYQYVVGPVSALTLALHDAVTWLALAPVVLLGGRRLWRAGRWAEVGLGLGLLASLAAFYLVAGCDAIGPHRERYALFCIVPTALLAAACLAEMMQAARARRCLFLGVLLLGGVWLATFAVQYLLALQQHGSRSHVTFRTGPVEPKEAGLRRVLQEAGASPAAVVAEDWWLYWPVRYLAAGSGQVRVLTPKEAQERTAARPGERWFALGFSDGPLRRRLIEREGATREWTVRGSDGEAVLYVWELAPPRANGRPAVMDNGGATP